MRTTHILLVAFSILFAFFFVAMGVLLFMIPFSAGFRQSVLDFVQGSTLLLCLSGMSLASIGGSVLYWLLRSHRRNYYHVETSGVTVDVDQEVFAQLLEQYWLRAFPTEKILSHLEVCENKVKVVADMPFVPYEDQKDVIRKVEEEVAALFAEMVGYKNEISLSVSFPSPGGLPRV